MKQKRFLKLILVLVLVSFTMSCNDQECYSCDSEIDSWAKENKEALSKMDRYELMRLSSKQRAAAFRAFSAEKRKEIWIDKFNQILSIIKSSEERNHLEKILKFVEGYDFSREITEKEEKFFRDWFSEGEYYFEWNKYFMVSGFASLGDAVTTKKAYNALYNSENTEGRAIETDDDCDCRWDTHCDLAGLGDCSDDDCEDTTLGCGLFFMQSCTGDCSG